ncbi:MAG: SURF1 family protein, partial [Gammaproteobacteria bacterium]
QHEEDNNIIHKMKLYRLILVGAMALCLALSFWQLHRAELKQHLQDKNQKIMPVRVTGRFDNAHVILLDNKVNQGRVGYEVVIPLITEKSKEIILVNQGWIPRGLRRDILPAVTPIEGLQTITGYPTMPAAKNFRLGPNIEVATWPLRLQQLDQGGMAEVTQLLGKSIAPTILSVNPPKPPPTSASKHRGYAVQWFLLAIVLLVFLVIHARKQ